MASEELALGSPNRDRIATACIATLMVLSLVNALRPLPAAVWTIGALAFAAASLAHRHVRPSLVRVSVVIVVACALVIPFSDQPRASLLRGISLGGTLIALVTSVSLLSSVAVRSNAVRRLAERLTALSGQPRYLGFTAASQLFGGMLGLAGMSLLMHVAGSRPAHQDPDRLPTFLAITRAFAGASLWSPMVSNLAIMLALYPGMTWLRVLPTALALSCMMVGISFLVRQWSRRRGGQTEHAAAAPQAERNAEPALGRELLPAFAATAGFLALVLGSSWAGHVSVSVVIVILAPAAAFAAALAMASKGRRIAIATGDLRSSFGQLPRLAGEVMLFMASACAGSVIADAVPRSWMTAVSAPLAQAPELACLALILWVVVFSFSGIHPVMSAVFIATALPPQLVHLPALEHLSAIMVGWSISGTVTPFSIGGLMASRYSGLSVYRLSTLANGAFATIAIGLSTVVLGTMARLA